MRPSCVESATKAGAAARRPVAAAHSACAMYASRSSMTAHETPQLSAPKAALASDDGYPAVGIGSFELATTGSQRARCVTLTLSSLLMPMFPRRMPRGQSRPCPIGTTARHTRLRHSLNLNVIALLPGCSWTDSRPSMPWRAHRARWRWASPAARPRRPASRCRRPHRRRPAARVAARQTPRGRRAAAKTRAPAPADSDEVVTDCCSPRLCATVAWFTVVCSLILCWLGVCLARGLLPGLANEMAVHTDISSCRARSHRPQPEMGGWLTSRIGPRSGNTASPSAAKLPVAAATSNPPVCTQHMRVRSQRSVSYMSTRRHNARSVCRA